MPMTRTPKTVMVTGVGAIIGYGVIRALRQCGTPVRIIGLDIFSDAVGQHWCDAFRQAPLTSHPEYLPFIHDMVRAFQVDLIIPGIEQDVSFWANHVSEMADMNAQVVLNPPELITLADDKWITHQALVQKQFATIPTVIEGTFESLSQQWGVPFLIKPRRSYASKGIERVFSEADFNYWHQRLGDNFMAQQRVGSDEDEYTCAVFGDGQGRMLAHICFRRTLSGEGSTAKAEVVFNTDLTERLIQLTQAFQPQGPCNFQFRKHQGEFLLLEINPRISSSTSLRTLFGYNEAQLCLDFYLHQREIFQPAVQAGKAVRYIEDVLLA
ncbi:ATP-grasp domain-containing protein [Vampirovibrio sp.]|uniref:ATP-grasp domain-containing protein n=1 Tax=Vampirovibrio sp. TaxID=2717857 RepID=UPI0035938FFA